MKAAFRALALRPVYSAVVVATLAIGFGVNAAIFALTRTVLLRAMPYPDGARLVQVAEVNPTSGFQLSPVVPANYLQWRDRVTGLEATAAWRVSDFAVTGPVTASRVLGARIEPAFFQLLGVAPALGRMFDPSEARTNDRIVVLADGYWRRVFGGDPHTVGRTLTVDGELCTIVGVLPSGFKFFRVINRELEIWRPLILDADDHEHSVNLYARLAAAYSVAGAQDELTAAYRSLPRAPFRDGWLPAVSLLSTRLTAAQRPVLAALQVAVALVFGIAAANIANLLLVSTATRRKDMAVRVAIGASPWRLALELGREVAVLTAIGCAAALLLAFWMVDFLNTAVSYQDINRLEPFGVDIWVVAFTLGLSCATTVLLAILPARHAAAVDVVDALKSNDAGRGTAGDTLQRRSRSFVIVGQLALALILLTSAVELGRSALRLSAMRRGFDGSHVMTAQVSLNGPAYEVSSHLVVFADAVMDRLRNAPGIETASLVNYPPLSLIATSFPISIPGRADSTAEEPRALCWIVAPRYFETVGIPMLAGHDFPAMTSEDPGVVVVSRRLAERFWNRTNVIGEHLTVLFPQSKAFWIPRGVRRPLTIIGVVGDVKEDGLAEERANDPQLYLPYAQNPTQVMTLVAKTSGPPERAAPFMREAVRAVDSSQPVFGERTLAAVRSETLSRPRELAWLIGGFAALALLLSAMGVYGVVAQLVTAREREIGIRIALGATRARVVRLVVAEALRTAAVGVTLGIVATPMSFQLLNASVVGVRYWSGITVAAVAVGLLVVAGAAAALPARRAARNLSLR